ncbi:ubiquitin thioesterase OTU1 isoform X2 [Petromyzon marinus]|uniref:ubiquitin thioesterase OTU1 isoform X2 n=1 Tax=Petromyzon marinus TaxID=7757 RepID=UPI003F6F4B69
MTSRGHGFHMTSGACQEPGGHGVNSLSDSALILIRGFFLYYSLFLKVILSRECRRRCFCCCRRATGNGTSLTGQAASTGEQPARAAAITAAAAGAATMLRLRCKSKSGTHAVAGLSERSSLRELQARLSEATGIAPAAQRIMAGFPPCDLDLARADASLSELHVKSGDTLIVEEDTARRKTATRPNGLPSPRVTAAPAERRRSPPPGGPAGRPASPAARPVARPPPAQRPSPPSPPSPPPALPMRLSRHVVPADNSCLFTSVSYALDGPVAAAAPAAAATAAGRARELRRLIASVVAGEPDTYSEALLGKPNAEYCRWIEQEDTWGGAIELSILARFYECEICVADTQTLRVDRFGEGSGYARRALLIYDGIHYDPLELSPVDGAPHRPPRTLFPTTDDVPLAQAQELAEEARRRRQFTDLTRFALRCLACQKGLTGQREAQRHAEETGHLNFGEV